MKFLIGHPEHPFTGDAAALMDNLHGLLGGNIVYHREHRVGRPLRIWLEITHSSRRRKPEAIAGLIRAELDKLGCGDVTVQFD
jgi:hypothetical protein